VEQLRRRAAEGTGSYAAAGLATAANSALTAVASPVLGHWADRGRAVLVLTVCGLGEASLLVTMVIALRTGAPTPLVIGIAGLAGALAAPIGPVTRVVLPRLAPDPAQVQTAYALDAIAVELTYVAGPAVVGVIALAGPYTATLMCANVVGFASLLLSTGLVSLGALLLFAGLFIAPLTAVELLLVTALAEGYRDGGVHLGQHGRVPRLRRRQRGRRVGVGHRQRPADGRPRRRRDGGGLRGGGVGPARPARN
jgi:MFS family permease